MSGNSGFGDGVGIGFGDGFGDGVGDGFGNGDGVGFGNGIGCVHRAHHEAGVNVGDAKRINSLPASLLCGRGRAVRVGQEVGHMVRL